MTWIEALTYAQTSIGIAAIDGVVVFLAAEYIPGFVEQIENEKTKRLVILILSLVIALSALLLELLTVSHAAITPDLAWQALYTGVAGFGIATAIHTTVMKKKQ